MNVILYARVSTSDQSCEAQLLELRAYCAQKGMTISHEFSDTISGTKADRAGLDQVMTLVREKKIDAVMAVKIDRMARSVQHFSKMAAEFLKYEVALICPGQGIDTSKANPCGKFQMHIMSAVAELERDMISERTKAGLAVARAKGKTLGRPSVNLPPKETHPPIVRAWVDAGRSGGYDELGRRLGGVSRATAWRVAKKLKMVEEPVIDVG